MKKNRQISPERKMLYHGGQVVMVIGFLLFLSVFVTGAMNFGNFSNFHGQVQSSALRAISGMVMIIVGSVLMSIGAKGAAGSGIILDPEKARQDVEPWSRATGGMVKDGLEEAGVDLKNVFGSREEGSEDAADFPADVNATNFGDKLRELHRLYEEGILSKEEYEREKRETLDQI